MRQNILYWPLTLLTALNLTACVIAEPQPAPIKPVTTPQPVAAPAENDPYDTIEKATVSAVNSPVPEPSPEPEPAPIPSIWQRFAAEFTFPTCVENSTAYDWAVWYGTHQEYMDRVFHRAAPWLHDIANQVAARQLPADLALLPIVESAFDPFATSRGRAVGTWQFVQGTAGDFGLKINGWYDGRRDVYAATRAALDYLRFLFDKFDSDWEIALAAYNGGQGRVERALRRYRGNASNPRPQDLRLPRETRSYAPKLHGLSCLIREPERFGLQLPDIHDQPRITAVEFDGPLDLIIAARLADLDIAELYALNPGFSRWATPPNGPHRLILPSGHATGFQQAFAVLPAAERVRWHGVVVRPGDTLSAIAARTGTSVSELMTANQLTKTLIRPGQELRILGTDKSIVDSNYNQQLATLQKLQGRLLPGATQQHIVRRGESLWVIARRYGVSTKALARWNGLNNARRIYPGQRLQIARAASRTNTSRPLADRTPPETYRVRRGDSPWTIARRYRIKLDDLLRWNQLTEHSILRPGQTLRLRAGSG